MADQDRTPDSAPLAPLRDRLTEIEARTDAVPKGPWVIEGTYPQQVTNAQALLIAECFTGPQVPPSIAEFITAARTDIPVLVAALRAALRHHEPVQLQDGRWVCPPCSRAVGLVVFAPCEAVQDITAALVGTPEAHRG